MTKTNSALVTFNGGEVGLETISRVTLDNYAATAEMEENVWADANGPMCLRPGFQFLQNLGTDKVRLRKFVRSVVDKFLLAIGNGYLRVISNGAVIARPSVNATITNGAFNTLAGWTNISTGLSTATSPGANGPLLLNSNGTDIAGVRQSCTTSSPNVLHALNIKVNHGPVKLKVGSTAGAYDYIAETSLLSGYHSLGFTPTGITFWIEFTSALYRQIEVTYVQIGAAGDMVLTTPWMTADLQNLRFLQTLNVMYVASNLYHMKRIERHDNNSWSVVDTDELDGPFQSQNIDTSLTLTPSVRVGIGTITASRGFFKPGHVGCLFQLTQAGQFSAKTVNANNIWSDPVQVQGVGASRAVTFTVGTGLTGTVRLQRSIGNTTSWADATTSASTSGGVTITATGTAQTQAFNDGLDNNIVYYRVGMNGGDNDYTSGTGTVTIFFPYATTKGVVRIRNYYSSVLVGMEVLSTLAQATATSFWAQGSWSDNDGWPSGVTEFDGRLWTVRDNQFWGSYSGAYESYAVDTGNASTIARSIAVGGADIGQWLLGLGRLIIGTQGAEVVVRSNAFDEPLTTANMTVRGMSTFGVASVDPLKIDTRGLYVDVSGFHLMEIVYNVQLQDYVARPLTTLNRDIGRPQILQLAVMRRPDTRVLAVRGDGQILVKLYDPDQNVLGWSRWTSPGAGGIIESIETLPGGNTNQDECYAVIARIINGTTVRYLEKLAPVYYFTATTAYKLDSHVIYSGAPTPLITGLAHLTGQQVKVWGDGAYQGVFTVVSGSVTLTTPVSNACVGLDYTGKYKSSKLAMGAKEGTALAQMARPAKVSFILRLAEPGGIEYGQDFNRMDRLPDRKITDPLDSGPALVTMTTPALTVPGNLTSDARICLRLSAPYPAWIDGSIIGFEMNERVT